MIPKWTCEDGREFEIKDMATGHIRNCIRMLERDGNISESTFNFYMNTGGPSGEMDMITFERELEMIKGCPVSIHLDHLKKELRNRDYKKENIKAFKSWVGKDDQ